MFIPCEPHPFGNEYHTFADGDRGAPITWRAKIQEGKDQPMNVNEMSEPIHGSGRVVTHDSGFCMTAGILALHDVGVFGQALIKKRGNFWPVGVPGDQIDDHFASLSIRDSDALEQSIDGKTFLIHCKNYELSQNFA